jgi:DNA-binding CsgD family transcriptional regulator
LDRRSGLYSLLSLYRKNLDQPFLAHEKALQSRLVYHLFNAASHAFFLHLANTQGARPADCAAAVVDSELMFGEVQTRFLDLLDQFYPKREPFRLPFALPSEGGEHMDGLSARSQRIQKDLHLVYVWPTSPLDRLTQREREIVYAVAQGLSFKQAARKIGVAPSTVANHLYRVYRKLGVSSRTALAALVYPDSSETPK